jgi:hypothetical protein
MGKGKKHIDDLIKEGFSEPTFDNDIQGWSGISDRLDEKSTIDNVVFKAFEETQSELPIGAWSDMNDSLDIDTVWNRLASRRKRKPIIFWWKVAGVFVLLGILTGQLYNHSGQPINTTETTNKTAESGHKQNSTRSDNKAPSSPNNTTNSSGQDSNISAHVHGNAAESSSDDLINNIPSNPNYQVASNTNTTGISVNGPTSNSNTQVAKNNNDLNNGNNSRDAKQADQSENNIISSQETTPTQGPIDRLPIEPLHRIESKENAILVIAEDTRESIVPIRRKRFTIGVIGTLDNTWILDATTREGFSETSLVSNEASFGSSYGIYLDYSLPRNFSLSADFYINSTLKTRNYFYDEGNYIKRETRLEYYKFVLQANKNILFGRRKINAFHSGLGGYYSILNNEFDQLGVDAENKNYYLNADFGLKLELGHQININRFVVSYGLHLDYGMYNIFRGTAEINSTLNKTNNLSTGGYLRLGLRF